MDVKIVKDKSKELIKQEKKLEVKKKKAIKSISSGKGFVLLNLNNKRELETFICAGFKPKEVFRVIDSLQEVGLILIQGLQEIPCDCPNCKNKFSGVN